ncbi:hypothetical protein KBY27_22050 [Ruegeria pomeroyi]|uniref:Uncharacterized protein n=1 Tax=Ruegeria pomeroyi TaxID=89184 RepID=A0A9Q3WPR2_9RHOB|nr:hypothetical protein [Ruegeria pomeroyi]MCE8540155.1 hypothetical protein [Ruegeria pomeroyi]
MTPSKHGSGSAAPVPAILAEMQRTIERLYLSQQDLKQQVGALGAMHPVICRSPGRPGPGTRALMRLHGGYRRRYQARAIRDCGLFDAPWYLRRNPDVRAAGVDPVVHFLEHGAREGRDPGPHFSTMFYLRTYPDIAASGLNPLWHYLTVGWREQRAIRPGMLSEG